MKPTPIKFCKIPSNPKFLPSAALLSLAWSSALLTAQTGYDGFDYGATSGDLTGKNGGSGWSGSYTDTGSSSIYTPSGINA